MNASLRKITTQGPSSRVILLMQQNKYLARTGRLAFGISWITLSRIHYFPYQGIVRLLEEIHNRPSIETDEI
jgi:hypothetical protein